MNMAILPIVEGHSEELSIPILIRRILYINNIYDIDVARPFRIRRNKVKNNDEIERAIKFGLKDRYNISAIIIIIDADDDCPAELGPAIKWMVGNISDLPTSVILAKRELEAWFLGGKESLRGFKGIKKDALPPENPEDISGAKERLSKNMEKNRRYLEIDDQPSLVERLDINLTKERCKSFARLCREIENLVQKIRRVK